MNIIDGRHFSSLSGTTNVASVSYLDLFTGTTLKGRQQKTIKPKILKFCMETPFDGHKNFNESCVPIGTL